MEDHRPAEHGGCCAACPGNVGWIGGGPTFPQYEPGWDIRGVQLRLGLSPLHSPAWPVTSPLSVGRALADRGKRKGMEGKSPAKDDQNKKPSDRSHASQQG